MKKFFQLFIGMGIVIVFIQSACQEGTPLQAEHPSTPNHTAVDTVQPPVPASETTQATSPPEPTSPPVPTETLPQPPSSGSLQFQNPVRYQVDYVVTVHNRGYGLDKLLIYQSLPVEWDGQGEVVVESISPEPTRKEIEPVHGNGILYWDIRKQPKSGESLSFKIRFTFTGYEIISEVNPENIPPYDVNDPQYKRYTNFERFIESADPKIVDLANQVSGEETNPYRLARKFYDYVIDTAKYKLLGEGLLGAKYLVNNGVGECGDYASLFIALARAKGIPARPVVGYWAISGVNQTHVWAEFYVQDLGWIPVDPTIGQDRMRDYYFGNMDNQRVILNKGFNIKLTPIAPDNYVAPFLQIPLWWYWGSSGNANAMTIERTEWSVKQVP